MYSLNVPVPSAVASLAGDVARDLPGARDRARGEHTLVCKRLGGDDAADYHCLEARAREALAGTAPFRARVAGVDQFRAAAAGPSPVVYLAVESPELERLHDRLCTVFDPVAGLEGDEYVPHVTVARGGAPERADEVCDTDTGVDPVEWTVSELVFHDADRSRSASTVSLPC